jgi:hypothetical protein
MVARVKPKPPAFKHGGYSATAVLPGEDRAEFEKLHRELASEYLPSGPLQQLIVMDMARLIWRREHLAIFQVAKIAREPFVKIAREPFVSEERTSRSSFETVRDSEELKAADCAAFIKSDENQARNELGDMYDLVAAGEIATVPFLLRELDLMERLNGMIDSCIKRLLQAKGLSSISVSTPAPVRRLPAPTKAA